VFPKYVLLSIHAFIRVHFGHSGKFHSTHPSGVYTFFQKLVMISKKNFKRKAGSYPFSKACWLFSYTTYFPFSLFFLSLFKVIIICLFPFFFASLWKGRADEGAHYLLMSNHKVNEKKHVMVSPNKNNDEITESYNAKF